MKIRRDEFKAILKECLKEMAADGTLAQLLPQPQYQPAMMPQANPMVQFMAQQGKTPADSRMMESIFADSAANSLQAHLSADPMNIGQQQYPQQYYPQNGMVHVPQVAPMLPQQMPPVQMMPPPQQQQGGGGSNWARLAFNSPIRNRPGQESGGLFGGGNVLPGTKMGQFG